MSLEGQTDDQNGTEVSETQQLTQTGGEETDERTDSSSPNTQTPSQNPMVTSNPNSPMHSDGNDSVGNPGADVMDDLTDYQLVRDRQPRIRIPNRRFNLNVAESTDVFEYAACVSETVSSEFANIPETIQQAIKNPKSANWLGAMHEEIQSMHANRTWSLVPRPPSASLIDCKWIFRVKEGTGPLDPPRYKARLVAKGFTQKEGIDYNEIFAPVVKYKTLRLLLAMTAVFNWELEQMDVKTAFLHGDLKETMYMKQPEGFIDKSKPDHVCCLKKSIYGLKQSPRQWNIKFDSCMRSLGFTRSNYDSCVYFKRNLPKPPVYVLLYVDDILLICDSLNIITGIKTDLKRNFDMKDLGPAKRILGISITRDRKKRVINLSQSDYVLKVLDKFAMKNSKTSSIPLGAHLELSKDQSPASQEDRAKMADVPYDVAVGSVMYAMLCTRPDLAFAISVLSRFMSNPGEKHWSAMKQTLRYLNGSTHLGLLYTEHTSRNDLVGYVDSDFASNKDTRKSTTCFVFTWAGNCITWKSQQQSIVALSSTEAEYIAAAEACKEAIWLKGLLSELECKHYIPVLHMDSQSALHLCKDPVYHERTKHIDVRFHFIRDEVEKQHLKVVKVAGTENPADFGTKIVPTDKFLFCRDFLHISGVG
ncbi:Retrovirus-related Pol polyprotein from transposon TNT 1-94 [Linum perenne]